MEREEVKLLRIQPACLTEQLKNVAELPDGEVGKNEGYFAGGQLQSVILFDHKRDIQRGQSFAQVADFSPGDWIVKRPFHTITLLLEA
jgi:hypothetical protein